MPDWILDIGYWKLAVVCDGLRRSNVHPAINLPRIGRDDFTPVFFREIYRKARFAAAGRSYDRHNFLLHVFAIGTGRCFLVKKVKTCVW